MFKTNQPVVITFKLNPPTLWDRFLSKAIEIIVDIYEKCNTK